MAIDWEKARERANSMSRARYEQIRKPSTYTAEALPLPTQTKNGGAQTGSSAALPRLAVKTLKSPGTTARDHMALMLPTGAEEKEAPTALERIGSGVSRTFAPSGVDLAKSTLQMGMGDQVKLRQDLADANKELSAYNQRQRQLADWEEKYADDSDFMKGLKSIPATAAAAIPMTKDAVVGAVKDLANDGVNTAIRGTEEYQALAKEYSRLWQYKRALDPRAANYKERAAELDRQMAENEKARAAMMKRTAIDPNSTGMKMMREANWLRQEATEDLSGAGLFAANTALSIGQNAVLLPTAAINPAVPLIAMGTMSGAQKAYEVTEAGGYASDALARGIISGAIEAATEKLPLDTLADLVKTGGKGIVKNILKQAGVEATEEGISYAANYIADKAAGDPDAAFSVAELLESAAAGGLSGLFFGGVGTAANKVGSLPVRGQSQNHATAPAAAQDGVSQNTGPVSLPVANADGGQQKTASTGKTALPKMRMEDFTNTESPVWNNVAYEDTDTQTRITQTVHQEMMDAGQIVQVPETTTQKVGEAYPDLRGMKKAERTPILRQKIGELKTSLRQFLNSLKNGSYEFEVNGNILEARLYDTGVREVMEKVTKDKASMLYHSEQVFQNARYLYSTPDYDGDPNVYRWNYFYTPVQIGEETVGVRIAVRDMVPSAKGKMDSQIYNWGIKKDAVLDGGGDGNTVSHTNVSSTASDGTTLDGGGPGRSPNTTDVSSVAPSSDTTIPQQGQGVKEEYAQDGGDSIPYASPDSSVGAAPAAGVAKIGAVDYTEEERGAVLAYKSSDGYKINAKLRDGAELDEADRYFVKHMDSALKKMPRYQGTVYRRLVFDGVGDGEALTQFLSQCSEDGVFSGESFISASTTEDGYPVDGDFTVTIVIEGQNAHDAAGFGNNFENEVIFSRGTDFIVSRIETDRDGKPVVYMKEDTNYGTDDGSQLQSVQTSQAVQPVQAAGQGSDSLQEVSAEDPARGLGQGRVQGVPGEDGSYRVSEEEWEALMDEKPFRDEYTLDDAQSVGSAAGGFDPYSRFISTKDKFFTEGANAARPVDVPTTDLEGRNIRKTAATAVGAKAIPDEAVGEIQKMVMAGKLSYDVNSDKASVERAEKTLRDKGFDGALEYFTANVKKGLVSKDLATVGQQLLVNAANAGDTDALARVLSLYAQMETSAGQAVQAASILRKLPASSQLYAIQRAVSDLEGTISRKYGVDVKVSPELEAEFLSQTTQEGRDAVMEKIYDDIAAQVPSTWKDKWNAWRYLAMLGNPRTHVRNVAGNALYQPLRITKDIVASGIEKAAAAAGIQLERTKTALHDKGLYEATLEDWGNVANSLIQGSKYNEATGQIEDRRQIFKLPVLEKARKGNAWALEAEDALFKRVTYADALAKYLGANGVTAEQFKAGNVDPTLLSRARDYAGQEALKATFQDKNAFSDTVSRLGRYEGESGWLRAASTLVEGVLPFRRTPANILVRGMEYSPLGLAKSLTADLVKVKNGTLSAAQAIDNIAAGLTGSALFGLGAYLLSQGIVTPGEDDDEKQAAMDDLTGGQNYALNLPGGGSVTLDWLAPEALPFFMGVELADSILENGLTADGLLGALTSVAEPMLEMSMLQSVNDLLDSIKYADSSGNLSGIAGSALISYLTQAIPTIGGQVERTAEDKRMTTYTDKTLPLPTDVQYAIGRATARLPIAEYQQIPYIDAWGREEEAEPLPVRAVNNFLNPAYTSKTNVTAVDSEVQRLYNATGEGAVVPTRAPKSFKVGGETVNLSKEQYVTYAKARGQTAYTVIESLIGSGGYQKLSDTDKAAAIQNAYDYANALAKAKVSKYQSDGWIAKAQSSGIDPAVYILYYNATSDLKADKDKDGESISGSKKRKVVAEIHKLPIADRKKDFLFLDAGFAKSTLKETPWN